MAGGRQERGILVAYSGRRMAIVPGRPPAWPWGEPVFIVFVDVFADDSGESPWPVRLVGAVGTVLRRGGLRRPPGLGP